jgi:hypothetical protein
MRDVTQYGLFVNKEMRKWTTCVVGNRLEKFYFIFVCLVFCLLQQAKNLTLFHYYFIGFFFFLFNVTVMS